MNLLGLPFSAFLIAACGVILLVLILNNAIRDAAA